MSALPNHTALKEWSNVIDSLGRGDQVILLRKGGIADVSFGVDAERFYLYPTYFHQGEAEPRASVAITHWCEVVSTWTTHDHEVIGRLEPFVVIPHETLEARYRFRSDQALHLIAVRTFALARPHEIAFREAYAGCLSWISIEEEIDVDGSRPALDETVLRSKIDSVIGAMQVERAGSPAR